MIEEDNFLKDVQELCNNLDIIERYYNKRDYDSFLKELFKKFENQKKLWQVINDISMLRILIDLKNNKGIKESSFIYENNYLYQNILNKIIKNFEFAYFSLLYDFIYFENVYSINEKNHKNKYIEIYDKFKLKYGELDSNLNDDYSYIFLNEEQNNFITFLKKEDIETWNKFIQNKSIKEKKLNIIYTIFDKLDLNNYSCRTKFYNELFNYLIINITEKDNEYSKKIKIINSIIFLILNDNKNIFQIYSSDDQVNNDKEIANIFNEMIMKITEKIESLVKNITEEEKEILDELEKKENEEKNVDKTIKEGEFEITNLEEETIPKIKYSENSAKKEELLNSLILLLKLFGEYYNASFHRIICQNLNNADSNTNENIIQSNKSLGENKNEFIVIKKLICLYLDIYKSFDLEIKKISKVDKNLVIIFNSLTQCITGYTNIKEDIKIELIKLLEKYLKNLDNILFDEFQVESNKKEIQENQDKNSKENENEEENKILFINKNLLLFKIFCIKYLNLKNKEIKVFKDEDLQKMKFYFINFLSINSLNEILDLSNVKLYENNNEKIINDKNILFEYYKDNKFRKRLILLNLIILNYKIIFLLSDSPDYKIYTKCFFYINDENNLYIIKNYINQTFIEDKKIFLLLPLFSFLQEIRDIIEIELNNGKINLMNVIIPEIFNLKKYTKTFFNKIINLFSLYL